MPSESHRYKRPESVLVVVHTREGRVLMLKRTDHPDFWQSVTGSLAWGEGARAAAERELAEETGLDATGALRDLGIEHVYKILPHWRHRYAADVTENLEHALALEVPAETDVTPNPAEHSAYQWLDWRAAAQKATSWTNRDVILAIARQLRW